MTFSIIISFCFVTFPVIILYSWFSKVPVPDVMMPNSMLLPAAASEKSERDTPATITAEGSGKYSGIQEKSMDCYSLPGQHKAYYVQLLISDEKNANTMCYSLLLV